VGRWVLLLLDRNTADFRTFELYLVKILEDIFFPILPYLSRLGLKLIIFKKAVDSFSIDQKGFILS
jgi:hypothetical protein